MAFIKRFIPFIATFTIGILAASFFIEMKVPGFGGMRARRQNKFHAIRAENEAMKNEILRLRNEMQSHSHCRKSLDAMTRDEIYSLMPLDAPIPPPTVR
jgi:hypothetical protein